MKKYNHKKQFNLKSEAIKEIKRLLKLGLGNHFYLNALNSKKKYQTIEDYYFIRRKFKKEIRRKLSELN